MAEQVGNCPCPDCGGDSKVMADKRRFLYLNCKVCGIFKYQTHAGQARLRERLETTGTVLGEAAPAVASEPEPVTEPAPEPARKSRPFFSLFR